MLRSVTFPTSAAALALAVCMLSLPALARPPSSPDAKAMQAFTLTPKLLSKSRAVEEKLFAAAKKDPALRKQLEDPAVGSAKTLAEMEKRVDANPALADKK